MTRVWEHAVVVGGGFAGLVAARSLSGYFRHVTILDQDELTPDTQYRRGTPQARHPHAFLAKGADIVEEMFPGFAEELDRAGASGGDFGQISRLLLSGGWGPVGEAGIPFRMCTRALLENRLRRRVQALEGITVRGGFRVSSLVFSADGRTVVGVRGGPPACPETVEADLVIDASGRFSALRARLADAGYSVPADKAVDIATSYTSRLYDMPPDAHIDWVLSAEYPQGPANPRTGGIYVVESRRCLVWVADAGGEPTPADEGGFLEFARSLKNPALAECIETGTPAGELYRMTNVRTRWTPFHLMAQWPERLLAMGDVVCSLNPIYAQGMTVSAMQADMVSKLLAERAASADLTGLGRTFQRRAAKIVRPLWQMSASVNLGWPGADPNLMARLVGWYFNRAFTAMPHDSAVFRRFLRIFHLLDHPASLFTPPMMARILASGAAGNSSSPASGGDLVSTARASHPSER